MAPSLISGVTLDKLSKNLCVSFFTCPLGITVVCSSRLGAGLDVKCLEPCLAHSKCSVSLATAKKITLILTEEGPGRGGRIEEALLSSFLFSFPFGHISLLPFLHLCCISKGV